MPLSVENVLTRERQDLWNCATKWQAMLAVDIKQQTAAAGKETRDLRNDISSRISRSAQTRRIVNGTEVRQIART
jgi:hypothetical protein